MLAPDPVQVTAAVGRAAPTPVDDQPYGDGDAAGHVVDELVVRLPEQGA